MSEQLRTMSERHFNSIKVRLNLPCALATDFVYQIFQFHKGTIKPRLKQAGENVAANFNSIKVRLNLLSTVTVNLHSLFQFHKGTIKPYLHQIPQEMLQISIP